MCGWTGHGYIKVQHSRGETLCTEQLWRSLEGLARESNVDHVARVWQIDTLYPSHIRTRKPRCSQRHWQRTDTTRTHTSRARWGCVAIRRANQKNEKERPRLIPGAWQKNKNNHESIEANLLQTSRGRLMLSTGAAVRVDPQI